MGLHLPAEPLRERVYVGVCAEDQQVRATLDLRLVVVAGERSSLVAASLTTLILHGWMFRPDGAKRTISRSSAMVSSGTGRPSKSLHAYLLLMSSWKSTIILLALRPLWLLYRSTGRADRSPCRDSPPGHYTNGDWVDYARPGPKSLPIYGEVHMEPESRDPSTVDRAHQRRAQQIYRRRLVLGAFLLGLIVLIVVLVVVFSGGSEERAPPPQKALRPPPPVDRCDLHGTAHGR